MEVLRLREFRLLFSAQAVSNLGDRMVPIALAFPVVATLIIGGVVADRVSRRTVMIVADVVRVLSQGVTAALLIAGVAQVWELAVLAGVTGAAGGFFYPAVVGVMPLIVPREQLGAANGVRATALSVGEI